MKPDTLLNIKQNTKYTEPPNGGSYLFWLSVSSCIALSIKEANRTLKKQYADEMEITATENVMLSMDVSGKKIKNKRELAVKLLQKVNLEEQDINRGILKLSGGQQQRVAIARALADCSKGQSANAAHFVFSKISV